MNIIGKTIVKIQHDITRNGMHGNEGSVFTLDDGSVVGMFHYQDCCESVNIEETQGDEDNIIGSPITYVSDEEVESSNPEATYDEDSFTITHITIRTNKGSVTYIWHGSSNGYYGEGVSFEELENNN